MTGYKKRLFDFIEESMKFSVAQKECYENIRGFFIKNYGKDPPIIETIDILHHPSSDYRKRRLGKVQALLSGLSPFRIWEVAQTINIAKDLHQECARELFIPNSYFYDLKAFFLNILFLFMLNCGECSQVSRNFFMIENEGLTLSIKVQRQANNGSRIFLVDLSEKGSVSKEDMLRFSRGLHILPKEVDEDVFEDFLAVA